MRLVTTLCALSAMVLQAEPIGLVLSGGGARGAYEVGTIVVVYLDNEKRLGQDRVIATTKRCSTASLTG